MVLVGWWRSSVKGYLENLGLLHAGVFLMQSGRLWVDERFCKQMLNLLSDDVTSPVIDSIRPDCSYLEISQELGMTHWPTYVIHDNKILKKTLKSIHWRVKTAVISGPFRRLAAKA